MSAELVVPAVAVRINKVQESQYRRSIDHLRPLIDVRSLDDFLTIDQPVTFIKSPTL